MIYKVAISVIAFFLVCCTTYSDSLIKRNANLIKREQETHTKLFDVDGHPKIVARLAHLNPLGSAFYKSKEYFFLELYCEEEDSPLIPHLINLTLDGSKYIWMREIDGDEFDNILFTHNTWSRGYLVAFKKVPVVNEKDIKVRLDIAGFKSVEFDFSYVVLQNTI